MGPEDQEEGPQNLATETTDGGTTPQDMNCAPKLVKLFTNADVMGGDRDSSCWSNSELKATNYDKRTTYRCDIKFNSVGVVDKQDYVLEIDYKISDVTDSSLTRLLRLSPHVMYLPNSGGAPYFDFMPNPRSGSHSAKIPFLSTSNQFDLVLSFHFDPTGGSGIAMDWTISRIALSTVCPK